MNGKKIVVITGASSGIGRATALEFVEQGHTVVLVARKKEALEDLSNICERYGPNAMYFTCDVSRQDEVEQLVQRIMERFGRIDVWVNNAAVALMGPFTETPMEDMRRLMDINVMGYLYGAYAVVPIFKRQRHGTLINVSSIVGITGQPFSVAYSTSKFAIRGMGLSLRQELMDEKDIHVCTVLPATVDTPLFDNAANYMGREVKAMPPVVDAREVAEQIVALAKDPKPEVIVGGMGIQNMLMKYLSPDLFANMFHKQVKEEHFKEEREGPKHGNLYQPSRHATIGGGWTNGRSRAVKMRNRNIMWAAAAVVGALAGAAAILAKGQHGRQMDDRDPAGTFRNTSQRRKHDVAPVIPATKEDVRDPDVY